MAQSTWPVLLLSLSYLAPVHNVNITALWLPDTFQEGTRSSMILDCVYNYTLDDRDSLEIKWYFKQGLNPVYQWIPPNPPQIISPLFQKHAVTNFEATSDPFTKHRALNLANVTTDLSGLYSCRVSSINGDSFLSKQLTIFSPPQELQLKVSHLSQNSVNVSCSIGVVYPQPTTRLVIISKAGDTVDLSKQSSSSTQWINGKFNQRTDIILDLPNKDQEYSAVIGGENRLSGGDEKLIGDSERLVLLETDVVQCEVRLPGTTYNELLYRKVVSIQPRSAAPPTLPLTPLLLYIIIFIVRSPCY